MIARDVLEREHRTELGLGAVDDGLRTNFRIKAPRLSRVVPVQL